MDETAPQDRGHYFLSYSRSDERFAMRLAADMRERGMPVWVDQLDIRPSEHWDRAIERAVRDCLGLIVILSPRSVASDNVADEISFAIDSGKSVLPVVIEKCVLPLRITRMQVVDATSNYEKALEQCIVALAAPGSTPSPQPRDAHPTGVADPEVLASAKRRLTHYLGPIAGKLVDQAASRVWSAADLYELLAQRIDSDNDRQRFLTDAGFARETPSPERPASVAEPSAISMIDVDSLAKTLTAYLGPIAPIVARRESSNCTSLADLRDRLAGMIPAEQDRKAFLQRLNAR